MTTYTLDPDTGLYVLSADQSFSVSTDQSDYAPGSTASFTANVAVGDTVTFDVIDVAGTAVSGTNTPWTVTDGGVGDLDNVANGVIQTTWAVGQDAAGEAFVLSATDQAAGLMATAQFTDSPTPTPVDLTAHTGTVSNAIFINTAAGPDAGTGNFNAFLGIQNTGIEQGYNTDGTPTPLDDKTANVHTGSLQLGHVALVNADGTAWDHVSPAYREFILDIDQSGNSGSGNSDITLNTLQIYLADQSKGGALLATGPFTGTAAFGANASLVYNLGDNPVLLSDHASGNGQFDYKILIPDSDFAGGTDSSFVYLYAQFSGANAGFEEFGTGQANTTPPVLPPAPSAAPLIDKQVTGDNAAINKAWFDQGGDTTAPVILAAGQNGSLGTKVYFQSIVTNHSTDSTGGVAINASVQDVSTNPTPDFSPFAFTVNGNQNFTVAFGDGNAVTTDLVTQTALAGSHTDTATVTGTATNAGGHDTETAQDNASYFGATAGITVDKQISGDGITWLDQGNGNLTDVPVILTGFNVYLQAIATNQSNGGLGVTKVSVTDVNPNASFAGATSISTNATYTLTTKAQAGTQTDTATVNGTVSDSFGNSTDVTASDQANYFGATPAVNVEKLVSVNGGLDWYFTAVPGDTFDNADYISNVTGIDKAHLHIGTPLTFAGQSVLFEAVVTDTSTTNNTLTETVTVSDDTYGAFTFGGNLSTAALSDNGHVVSDVLHEIAGGTVFTTFTDTATATGTVTDSFGNVAHPTDIDQASFAAAAPGLPGLSAGFWTNHLTDWDGIRGNDSKAASLESAGTLTKAYLPTTDDVNPLANGVLLGDIDHSGTTNGSEHTLFLSLLAAQNLLGQSAGGNADVILFNQLIAAQLNDYNDGGHEPNGLIEAAVNWATTGYTAGSLTGGNVDTNHDGILETQSITATGKVVSASSSITGLSTAAIEQLYVGESVTGTGILANTKITSIGTGANLGTIGIDHAATSSVNSDSLTFSSASATEYNTSSKAFAATLSTSSPAWTAFSQVFDEGTNSFTAIDGNQYKVTADGEGLKNALQAYDQGQLVISSDGSLVGWNNGSSVTDVHLNTSGAFWGILEDQNLLHPNTIIGIAHA